MTARAASRPVTVRPGIVRPGIVATFLVALALGAASGGTEHTVSIPSGCTPGKAGMWFDVERGHVAVGFDDRSGGTLVVQLRPDGSTVRTALPGASKGVEYSHLGNRLAAFTLDRETAELTVHMLGLDGNVLWSAPLREKFFFFSMTGEVSYLLDIRYGFGVRELLVYDLDGNPVRRWTIDRWDKVKGVVVPDDGHRIIVARRYQVFGYEADENGIRKAWTLDRTAEPAPIDRAYPVGRSAIALEYESWDAEFIDQAGNGLLDYRPEELARSDPRHDLKTWLGMTGEGPDGKVLIFDSPTDSSMVLMDLSTGQIQLIDIEATIPPSFTRSGGLIRNNHRALVSPDRILIQQVLP